MRLLALLLLVAGCRSEKAIDAGPSRAELMKQLADIRPGEERAMGEGLLMKMHRIGASEPIDGGWHLAQSTEGGFSVELPIAFNDFRVRGAKTSDGVELRTHVVGAKTPGLLAWSATCLARRDGQLGEKPRPPAPPKVQLQAKAAIKNVEFEELVCVLVVEAQGSEPLATEADRDRFFGSLKRTGKPRW